MWYLAKQHAHECWELRILSRSANLSACLLPRGECSCHRFFYCGLTTEYRNSPQDLSFFWGMTIFPAFKTTSRTDCLLSNIFHYYKTILLQSVVLMCNPWVWVCVSNRRTGQLCWPTGCARFAGFTSHSFPPKSSCHHTSPHRNLCIVTAHETGDSRPHIKHITNTCM